MMNDKLSRRMFLGTMGAAAAATATANNVSAASDKKPSEKILIVGVSCSPRKGKTTATAVKAALDAAEQVDPRIEIEMIDLGGLEIAGWSGGAKPDKSQQINDDFKPILTTLRNPSLGGLIIGSPVYFRTMSALCKVFLERCAVLRKPELLLADKPVGALAVGSFRNGGQELTIEHIQTVMLCHEMMIVGGKPKAHQGATLWNFANDDITKDELGMDTARKLGIRVAEAAIRLDIK